MGRWEPADRIVLRYVRPTGEVGSAMAVTVVSDDDDLLVLWQPTGAPVIRSVLLDGGEVRSLPVAERFTAPRRPQRDVWRGGGVLRIYPTGALHSVVLFRTAAGAHTCWYVNLEGPVTRTRWTLDSSDHVLDLVVAPDRTWAWKDEDELAAAVAAGRFTPARAARIRAEGERVIAALAAGTPPGFEPRWLTAAQDPSWPVPDLPADWDAPVPSAPGPLGS